MGEKKLLIAGVIILAFALGVMGSAVSIDLFKRAIEFISSGTFFVILLAVLIFLVYKRVLLGKDILKTGLYLLILGAFFATLRILALSEPILRASFVFWILGLGLNFFEHNNE